MIFSHILSSSVLAGTGIGVFWYFSPRVAFFNRLLWGFFFLTVSLAALIGIAHYMGSSELEPLYRSMQILADSLGIVCAVGATWGLLARQTYSLPAFLAMVLIGVGLFVLLLLPDGRAFTPIVPAMGILVLMLMAVWALMQRSKHGLWVVLAAMMMGLATKSLAIGNLIHPIDLQHYATAFSLWFFGKAVRP
ncbi:hypothetical protein GCM10027578_29380 [Spirosoma luteolum]